MTRLTAKDFSPELLQLYDGYAHGRISKREFLDGAARFAVAGMTAPAILAAMSPDYALAQQVEFTDPEILPEYVTYDSPEGTGEVRAYMVRPATPKEGAQPGPEDAGNGPFPAVVVVHENRGLNPYIEDVARRLAKAGFLALAPDGLTSVGGYPGNDEEGRELQSQVDATKLMNDFLRAVDWLRGHDLSTGNVGIVGFCYAAGSATRRPWRSPS
ncbi:Dienelactone hydrolase family [Rubellimicrobium mesophilum DSM 19309]|uniref:Dienelactone hydrolase family n=1 Tax=Rubellimicrobium mesophilum DSM 19309 TaxID=442562 RepID=A0A017HGJ0_9RHOB|nr:Dienelactone hydrolase family [Rubellimicrobium mesophilum DSM 19309]